MFTQDIESVVKSLFEALNNQDFNKITNLLDPNVEITYMPTGDTMRGAQAYTQAIQAFRTAFPDNHVDLTNLIVAEDWATAEYTGSGTNTGPLSGMIVGMSGDFAPTSHRIDLPFCDVYEFNEGKIVRIHVYYDAATMMRQLGLMSGMQMAA